MKILIIGQCTLHWGRMEFGNIGNYYIIEPFFKELRRVFSDCEIRTTFQMSQRFCLEEKISILPMELYYGWTGNDLKIARMELEIAEKFVRENTRSDTTAYIDAVDWSDIVIDFSGDIWGENADFLGPDRFEVGLLKDRTAQLLGKKTVMIAGSPGPFSNSQLKEFAKEVYRNFDLVTNREPLSTNLLEQDGFECSNTLTLACPAFLFQAGEHAEVMDAISNALQLEPGSNRPVVGFIICGWNFSKGPFDKWPRDDDEYTIFAEAVEFLSEKLGAKVCLMSHSNGFNTPPASFKLIHGRDYPVAKQLQEVLRKRGTAKDVVCLDGVYSAWETKAIIGTFDMLVSGRVHAAVAGLSQYVPTVIIDYGHEPKAHKLKGFANIAGVQNYVVDPLSSEMLIECIASCWKNRSSYIDYLKSHMPTVRKQARTHFDLLRTL